MVATEVPRWMDPELAALRELARDFCVREIKPNIDRYVANKQVDRDLWRLAGKVGLLCMSIPEAYGGGGGTFAHEAVLIEEQSRVGDTSWGAPLHSGIVAHYLLSYGTEEQKTRWLPRMASGETIGAIAMTEPGAGSDLQAVRTSAIRDGDDYVVNGAKTFITNGVLCDLVVLVVKTRPQEAASGISLLLVETDRPGFRRGPALDKIGMKGQDTCELFFDDVRVPAGNLLGGTEGQGFAQLMQQLPQERLIVALGCVAAMETALASTIEYTRSREAFGRPLFGFQNTKFTLAEVATQTRVARCFVDDCLHRHLAGELDIATAAMAKYWASEQAMQVLDRCVQLHGGYGYIAEYPIARAWADMRVQQIYAGTTEIMKELISRSL